MEISKDQKLHEVKKSKFDIGVSIANLKQKLTMENLAFLAGFIFIYAFSCFLLTKANLHFLEFFDLTRASVVAQKFVSIYSILFVLIFSVTIALSTIIAYRLGRWASVLTFIPSMLISLLFFLMTSKYLAMVFICFSIFLAIVALFAGSVKKEEQKSFWKFWDVIGKSLMFLTILSFGLTAFRVSEQKELVFSTTIQSGFNSLGDVKQQAVNTAADMIANVTIPTSVVEGALNQTPFYALLNDSAKETAKGQMTPAVRSMLQSLAQSMKNSTLATGTLNATEIQMFTQMAKGMPMVSPMYNYLEWITAIAIASLVSGVSIILKAIAALAAYLLAKI